jgi:predicted hydrocarbon binding protein
MVERARVVGLSEDLLDFDSKIDPKGTYHDNMRLLYREYPQLGLGSDYLRIKPDRRLGGTALEQSWRSYNAKNGYGLSGTPAPELVITYTVGGGELAGGGPPEEPEPAPIEPSLPEVEITPGSMDHEELVESLLGRFTAIAGENVTRKVLHDIGHEIGRTAFHHSKHHVRPDNLRESLDHALGIRGLGRVIALERREHQSEVAYFCTVQGTPFRNRRMRANPICDILRGIVSRWLESFFMKNAENVQATCPPGSHECVIRVTFTK